MPFVRCREAFAIHTVDTYGCDAPVREPVRLPWCARPGISFPERFPQCLEEYVRRRRSQPWQCGVGHHSQCAMDEAHDGPQLRSTHGGPVSTHWAAHGPVWSKLDHAFEIHDKLEGDQRCRLPTWLMARANRRPVAPGLGPHRLRAVSWRNRQSGKWHVPRHWTTHLQGSSPVVAIARGLAR
jgi:hypothetical protein